jgi:hypothetical protein
LLPNGTCSHSGDHGQSSQESDAIEATRFFGEVDMSSSSAHSRYCVYYSNSGIPKLRIATQASAFCKVRNTQNNEGFNFFVKKCVFVQKNRKLKCVD